MTDHTLEEIARKTPRIFQGPQRSAKKPVRARLSNFAVLCSSWFLSHDPAILLDDLQNTLPGSSPATEHGHERAVSAAQDECGRVRLVQGEPRWQPLWYVQHPIVTLSEYEALGLTQMSDFYTLTSAKVDRFRYRKHKEAGNGSCEMSFKAKNRWHNPEPGDYESREGMASDEEALELLDGYPGCKRQGLRRTAESRASIVVKPTHAGKPIC
jgi:hypothetical protein